MTRLEWQDTRYALQAGHMDNAHKEFVQLINKLGEANEAEEARHLELLLRQCEDHFAQEQQWMVLSQMPAMENHLLDHESVLTRLRQALSELQGGKVGAGRAIAEQMVVWFDRHATTMDAGLAFHMQQHAQRVRPGIPAVG